MDERYRLILCFSLGTIGQALLLLRGNLELTRLTLCLVLGAVGLIPWRNEREYDLPFHVLFSLSSFIFAIAVSFRDALLPRVNEKILLIYTVTVWYALYAFVARDSALGNALTALLLLPSVATLWLAFSREPLVFSVKLFFYGWYLAMSALMVLFQFSVSYMLPFLKGYTGGEGSPGGAVLAGMTFCYMAVNVVFLLKMIPFKSKNESWQEAMNDWREWVGGMTRRYDEGSQFSAAQAVLALLLSGGALAANYRYGLVSHATAVNLAILLPLLVMSFEEAGLKDAGPRPGPVQGLPERRP